MATLLTAAFNTKDQNWSDENTIYWFDVTGTNDGDEDGLYGISDCNGEKRLLDCDGCPCNADDHHMAVVFDVCLESLTSDIIAE